MHVHLDDFVPFVSWIRGYGKRYIKADLFAGLTVAVVAVPQSMAYALIAGLPVQYGLYASIVPTIVGCLWGSSAHLITGPTTAVSLVVFSSLSPLARPDTAAYLELAFFLAMLVGVIQIGMGVARVGALLNFVSHAVLLGFTAGAAVLIAFKQVPGLLGIKGCQDQCLLRTPLQHRHPPAPDRADHLTARGHDDCRHPGCQTQTPKLAGNPYRHGAGGDSGDHFRP